MLQRCTDRLCEKWVLILLVVVESVLFLACGNDEYTANVLAPCCCRLASQQALVNSSA